MLLFFVYKTLQTYFVEEYSFLSGPKDYGCCVGVWVLYSC